MDTESSHFNKQNPLICIVGLGGLGCETIIQLAMVGYKRFILIDMDTVENANVGRQILFSIDDIGKFKVECVMQCLLNRWNDISCYTHCNSFETMDLQLLQDIDIIIGCVDNLEARAAINAFALKESKIYIDGGSMGFGGQVQIIIPYKTPCFQCLSCLFSSDPNQNIPLCTLTNHPTKPEHCILWAYLIQWEKERNEEFDDNNREHIQWILDQAIKRGKQFDISEITYEITQLVLHNTIITLPSTNAILASLICQSIKNLCSSQPLQANYIIYRGDDGVFIERLWMERNEECEVCNTKKVKTIKIHVNQNTTLDWLVNECCSLCYINHESCKISLFHQMTPLYCENPSSLFRLTQCNLEKTLYELNIQPSTQLELRWIDHKQEFICNITLIV